MFKALSPGTVVDRRYRIESVLGRGGMGTVYGARHLSMERMVAIKIVHQRGAWDDRGDRLAREARAASRLNHPACVRVLDHGRTMGRHFLVMELLEGPTLAQAIARGPGPSVEQALEIIRTILSALAVAHLRGVLHRDLKPANVILTVNGPVVIDFGLARIEEDAPLTAAGICAGTLGYVAPERLLGEPYDARADIYSAGVMLYELIAGEPPFRAKTPTKLASAHLGLSPPPLPKGTPVALDAVVRKALAKDPAERFETAISMAEALGDLADDPTPLRVLGPRRSPMGRALRRLRRTFSGPTPSLFTTMDVAIEV